MSAGAAFIIGLVFGVIAGGWLTWQVCSIRFSAWMAEGWGILAKVAMEGTVTSDHVVAVFGADSIRGTPL